jgi:hypothetical protein
LTAAKKEITLFLFADNNFNSSIFRYWLTTICAILNSSMRKKFYRGAKELSIHQLLAKQTFIGEIKPYRLSGDIQSGVNFRNKGQADKRHTDFQVIF